jgi:hypothetical protein
MSNCVMIPNSTGHFVCWRPRDDTKGISKTSAGYLRMNFLSKKVMCHVFAWLYHHPGMSTEDGDISHRCHNPWCCRPGHLVLEDRVTNKSRDNCPGFIIHSEDDSTVIQVCNHEPTCCTSQVFSPTTSTVELLREQ